jgi:hypothetical protein
MRLEYKLLLSGMMGAFVACGSDSKPSSKIGGDGGSQTSAGSGGSDVSPSGGAAGSFMFQDNDAGCSQTCEQLGWACGYTVDTCGNVINCADEGRTCAADEVCTGGIDGPTQCVPSLGANCEVCDALPDCATAVQPTRLTGRVVSPGRDDADDGNQIGVPNAIVYILRDNDESTLPAISSGIPSGGESCDRCEDQDLGPVLVGAVTDATGRFVLEERVPVDREFVLVVKAGKFRRAVKYTLPASAACQTTEIPTALPDNVTRLPRSMSDGLAVNLPRVAVSTGEIDAMECVLEKMGISHDEFSNPGAGGAATPRVHLYRGGPNTGTPPGAGARMDDNTPHASALYTDAARMSSYDMVVSDCEGLNWDEDLLERDAAGGNVLDYVNRGGRLFASHLSFSWLHQNGSTAYDASTAHATGLGPAATWSTTLNTNDLGTGVVSLDRIQASPRIDSFAAWMSNEGIATAPGYTFSINEPRSQNTGIGEFSEEFVYRQDGNGRIQQFSFNTPYGAPAEAACGRVSYSGFHVSFGGGGADPFASSVFPNHCSGDLTNQEKVLLYMLFDLGACVGELPLPPPCVPIACGSHCGFKPDGCGAVVDCGPCNPH